jgi:ribulose-phosphate 3-epimerase
MFITPAVLPENFEQIIDKLFLIEGLCDRVQIDICDGVFGLEKTWLPYQEESLPHGFSYEFDCMVTDWQKYVPRVIALGATRVIAHIDRFSQDDIDELLSYCKEGDIYLGLSVSNNIDLEQFIVQVKGVAQHYPRFFIQVMGIDKIGAQGQPFDERVIGRIKRLRDVFPTIDIQVDGSMNNETITMVRNAGATCAVIGSYLFKSNDVRKTIQTLKASYS